jgi:homoserine O-succinyltransferase
MKGSADLPIHVAILDLNNGEPNQSMRCLFQLLEEFQRKESVNMQIDVFDIRQKNEFPGLTHDIYLSSGGPGNPLDEKEEPWQKNYFSWLDAVLEFNKQHDQARRKFVFFICYSFELACMHLQLGLLTKRKSPSFGVFPVHGITAKEIEPVFSGLPDPFYAVDSRELQVIRPNYEALSKQGSIILAIEKERPHVPLERCIMAIRFNHEMIGTQFHPEADAEGMAMHLQSPDKKETVISNHGIEKWKSMLEQLNEPGKIMLTYSKVIPNFLKLSLQKKSIHILSAS